MKFPSVSLKYLREDFLAGISVFLVTIPLCLGIALASGAPLFAGVISGIIGGLVVGYWSGSEVTVSGPAAGLTVIVLQAIQSLGYQSFLVSVVLAGVIQFILGWLKAGTLSSFFPNSTIRGMMVAIGLVIILKQFPHALGWDVDYEGEFEFSQQSDGENTFTEIFSALTHVNSGAFIISSACILFLVFWDKLAVGKQTFFKLFPSSLAVIFVGVGLNELFRILHPDWYLGTSPQHMVSFPSFRSWDVIMNSFVFPDFAALTSSGVYVAALTIALVASLESLITLEAADRVDHDRRYSSPNQELRAQGISNILCGLVGALPITAVVIRSSTNVFSGARTRLATMFHGLFLLISLITAGSLLQRIPLACLAALLIVVGFKLVDFKVFKKIYKEGKDQFIPFIITIVTIIFTDLLIGILVGLAVGVNYVLYFNFHSAIKAVRDGKNVLVVFSKDVSFLNKSNLKKILIDIKEGDSVLFDGARAQFIDQDIFTTLQEFKADADTRNIEVEFRYIVQRNISRKKKDGIV
ncbi:SulP family inorganic anion transporter [Dyadobacter psychrotolerans]|uniref:SulP family inorganic anion transporter n=1 Tax=Dyadobacter psychrotolerans TaxID=2541721 RepID=A0A4R5DZC8_9BACT|nr:SulP family inorganic anion transporter [Dyadobacter psychrotolerans]TDE16795.1 SulP family inorganic anion transporter [Dyadobacter psychrotolerans]